MQNSGECHDGARRLCRKELHGPPITKMICQWHHRVLPNLGTIVAAASFSTLRGGDPVHRGQEISTRRASSSETPPRSAKVQKMGRNCLKLVLTVVYGGHKEVIPSNRKVKLLEVKAAVHVHTQTEGRACPALYACAHAAVKESP